MFAQWGYPAFEFALGSQDMAMRGGCEELEGEGYPAGHNSVSGEAGGYVDPRGTPYVRYCGRKAR